MNEIKDTLFEIRIVGKDYTLIQDCLEDSYITFSKEAKDSNCDFFKELCKELFIKDFRTKKLYQQHFLDFDKVKKKIDEKLEKYKKNEILRCLDDRVEEITKQKEENCNRELQSTTTREKESIAEIIKNLENKINELIRIKSLTQESFQLSSDSKKREVVTPSKEDLLRVLEDEDEVNALSTIFSDRSDRFEITGTWSEVQSNLLNSHPLVLLLRKFSEDINFVENDELIVGRRKDRERDLTIKDCTLYEFFNGPRFGSLVGTVSKKYSCASFARVFSECLSEELKEYLIAFGGEKSISITVQIRSRFDPVPDKPFFLLEMLTKGNIRFNNYSFLNSNEDAAIYDCLLISILRDYLMKAYQKGVFRSYQTFHENGMKMKGTIDFARHIKENMNMCNGKIAYTYREKSVDNYLNHLILESYEHLKRKYYDVVAQNFDAVSEVREVIALLKRETGFPKYKRELIIKKCENPIIHPYYSEYEDLRKVCLSVLRGEGVSVMSGSGDEISGILYYIPDLWEEYLESQMTNMGVSSQEVIAVFSGENGFANKLRPDYVFRDEEDKPFMILDAKYKPGWFDVHSDGKFGYFKEDYSECIRNMNAIDSYATGVIFPYIKDKKNDNESINMHFISEYNKLTSFYTIPIFIPEPSLRKKKNAFSIWQKSLKSLLEERMISMKQIIESEKEKKCLIDNAINTVDLSEYKNKQKKACKVLI